MRIGWAKKDPLFNLGSGCSLVHKVCGLSWIPKSTFNSDYGLQAQMDQSFYA